MRMLALANLLTSVAARWESADYNNTFHNGGMLSLIRTFVQISPDSACSGGLTVELLVPGSEEQQSGRASVQRVVLTQGDLIVLPAYVFSRVRSALHSWYQSHSH